MTYGFLSFSFCPLPTLHRVFVSCFFLLKFPLYCRDTVFASENVLIVPFFYYLVTYHTRDSDVACIVLVYVYYTLIGTVKAQYYQCLSFPGTVSLGSLGLLLAPVLRKKRKRHVAT